MCMFAYVTIIKRDYEFEGDEEGEGGEGTNSGHTHKRS